MRPYGNARVGKAMPGRVSGHRLRQTPCCLLTSVFNSHHVNIVRRTISAAYEQDYPIVE
jgi:hypothetical protein